MAAFSAIGLVRVWRLKRHPEPPQSDQAGRHKSYLYTYTDIYNPQQVVGMRAMLAKLANTSLHWTIDKHPIGDEPGASIYRFSDEFARQWLSGEYGPDWKTSVPTPGVHKRGEAPVPMPGETSDWVKQGVEWNNT